MMEASNVFPIVGLDHEQTYRWEKHDYMNMNLNLLDNFSRASRNEEAKKLQAELPTKTNTSSSSSSQQQQQQQQQKTLLNLQQVKVLYPRTSSFDRRLNESVQFFEAVGETPPTSQSDIPDIIDRESENDEDEYEYEIQLDKVLQVNKKGDRMQQTKGLHHKYIWASPFHLLSDCPLPFPGRSSTSPTQDIDYKGICPTGLEITKRGTTRGNYSQLHRKAWLEVSDKRHRYGKNLRLYYRHWGTLGYPTNKFFDWLDSTGDAAGQKLPDISECPRSKLDSDTVLYITDSEVSRSYALSIVSDAKGRGRLLDADGEPVCTSSDGWIFVLRDGIIYGSKKVTAVTRHSKQRFHHSSFFGGKAVAAAGIIVADEEGFITHLYPHSGHYRPGEADMQHMLVYLYSEKVDLQSFQVDMQQIIHVCRHTMEAEASQEAQGKDENHISAKQNKKLCLHLQSAAHAAHFLSHKARCIREGVFSQIHEIQGAEKS
jgi:hypothetical protein